MKKLLIVGSLLAAAAAPVAASAATRCVNPQTNGTTGALVGAAGGAAVGSVLAGRHSRGEGAVLGALGGALLGGAIGHNQVRCPDGYYAYDEDNRQYYDNSGQPYQPQGGPGYGQPPPQPAYGNGPGYPQGGPGYGPPPQGGPGYGPGPDRGGPGRGGPGGGWWASAPAGIHDRIQFLHDRIQGAQQAGRLSYPQARRSFMDLKDIERQERKLRYRDGGQLNDADRDYLQGRLDRARQILHDDVHQNY